MKLNVLFGKPQLKAVQKVEVMDFFAWMDRYWGKPVPKETQAQECGLPLDTIAKWAKWIQDASWEFITANNCLPTKDQLVELWKLEHPPTVTRMTPFGPVEVPIPAGSDASKVRFVSEMTVDELKQLIVTTLRELMQV